MKLITFQCRATGYYPTPDGHSTPENQLEGGPVDRIGKPLHTLQDFLEGRAPYVSVAMDSKAFPYGAVLCIPAINLFYGREHIEFRVTDTGGAFKGKKKSRMDICVAGKTESYHAQVNRDHLVIAMVKE